MNRTTTILVIILVGLALFLGYWFGARRNAEPEAQPAPPPAPVEEPAPPAPEPEPDPGPPPRVRTSAGPLLVLSPYTGPKPKPVRMDALVRELEKEVAALPQWMKDLGLKTGERDVYRFQLDFDPNGPSKERWSLYRIEALEDGTWVIHLPYRALYLGAAKSQEIVRAAAVMTWTLERLDAETPSGLIRGWALWRSGVGPRWFKRGLLDSPLDSYLLEDPEVAVRYTYGQYVWDLARSRAWMRSMSDKEEAALTTRLLKGEDPGLGPEGFRGMSAEQVQPLLDEEARALIAAELEGPLDRYREALVLIEAGQIRPAHAILTEIATYWPNNCLQPDVQVHRYLLGLPLGLVDEAYSGLYGMTNGDMHQTSLVFDAHLGMAETFRRQEYIGMSQSLVEELTLFALNQDELKAARRAMGLIRIPDAPYPLQERWRSAAPVGPPAGEPLPERKDEVDEAHVFDHTPLTLEDAEPATLVPVPQKKRRWWE